MIYNLFKYHTNYVTVIRIIITGKITTFLYSNLNFTAAWEYRKTNNAIKHDSMDRTIIIFLAFTMVMKLESKN